MLLQSCWLADSSSSMKTRTTEAAAAAVNGVCNAYCWTAPALRACNRCSFVAEPCGSKRACAAGDHSTVHLGTEAANVLLALTGPVCMHPCSALLHRVYSRLSAHTAFWQLHGSSVRSQSKVKASIVQHLLAGRSPIQSAPNAVLVVLDGLLLSIQVHQCMPRSWGFSPAVEQSMPAAWWAVTTTLSSRVGLS